MSSKFYVRGYVELTEDDVYDYADAIAKHQGKLKEVYEVMNVEVTDEEEGIMSFIALGRSNKDEQVTVSGEMWIDKTGGMTGTITAIDKLELGF